jgi:alpha-beta hydrolase superfamily lysophospholipase
MNERAFRELRSPKDLVLVEGATHLFEEPGAMNRVATLAADWFERFLPESGAEARR